MVRQAAAAVDSEAAAVVAAVVAEALAAVAEDTQAAAAVAAVAEDMRAEAVAAVDSEAAIATLANGHQLSSTDLHSSRRHPLNTDLRSNSSHLRHMVPRRPEVVLVCQLRFTQ